jgi:protein TonB
MNDTIVLINNDKYGAPELKKLQQGFTFKGLIIAVTIHIALIAAYMLIGYINQSNAKEIPKNYRSPVNITEFDLTPPSIDEDEIPPVKQEDVTQKVKDLSSLQPEPVKKKDADDVVLKTQDELNNVNTTTSREGDTLIVANNDIGKIDNGKIDDKIDNVIKDTDIKKTYTMSEVDVVPECINLSSVRNTMEYPQVAVEGNIQGKVTARVLVNADGNVEKVGSLSGPDVFYDEVKDKAKNLQFTPGLQNNKPVKVWVTVPFSFKLQ